MLAVLGPDHLDALLPDVLASAGARSRPAQREGALTLFQYLPLTMEDALQVGQGWKKRGGRGYWGPGTWGGATLLGVLAPRLHCHYRS